MPLGLVHITRFTAEYNLKNNDSIWTVKILIKAGSVADLFCGYCFLRFFDLLLSQRNLQFDQKHSKALNVC